MATTFNGEAAISSLINTVQGALDNKVNDNDIAIDSEGIRVKNVKLTHEKLAAEQVNSIWADMNSPEWKRGITGKAYNPAKGSPIVLYNSSTGKKVVIACADYNATDYPTSTYTPIGIVVIPKYHTQIILPDGDPGKGKDIMMSLKYMNYDDPDNGGPEQVMRWGGYGVEITELGRYWKSPAITNSVTQSASYIRSMSSSGIYEEPVLIDVDGSNEPDQIDDGIMMTALGDEGTGEDPTQPSFYSYISSDRISSSNVESQACPGTYYHAEANYYCPSPFLVKDGVYEPNPAYYLPWNDASPSVTSNFKGKENTQIICSKITVADWQTVAAIPNSYAEGNYPAAACCWRYSTPGTSQGDWYLPASGELGYLAPFYDKHNIAVSIINYVYGARTAYSLFMNDTHGRHWASTQRSADNAYRQDLEYCGISVNEKNMYSYVHAFCIVD